MLFSLFLVLSLIFTLNGQTVSAVSHIEYGLNSTPSSANAIGYASFTPGVNFTLNLTVSVSALPSGYHSFWVRAMNDSGWSVPFTKVFYKSEPEVVSSITDAEYSIGMEVAKGQGISLQVTPNQDVVLQNIPISVANLGEGMHVLRMRSRSDQHAWGPQLSVMFFKMANEIPKNINALYYRLRNGNVLSGEYSVSGITPSANLTVNFTTSISAMQEIGAQAGNIIYLELYAVDESGLKSFSYTSAPITVQ